MKICPNCGYEDNQYWRHSRFDFNADYMEVDEFQKQFPETHEKLKGKKNFEPVDIGHNVLVYLRGAGSHYVYRVCKGDFRVPRERVRHNKKLVNDSSLKDW